MAAFIFNMNESNYELFIKTGALFIRSSDRSWASGITHEDDIFIYRENKGIIQGVFRIITPEIDIYYKNLLKNRPHMLCKLVSTTIFGSIINEVFENGEIPQRVVELFENSMVKSIHNNIIKDYEWITENSNLNGMIWGLGKRVRNELVCLTMNTLPDSLAQYYIEIIHNLGIKYTIQKTSNIVYLYNLILPPCFDKEKMSLDEMQNPEFMDSYILSLTTLSKSKLILSDAVPFEFRLSITVNSDSPTVLEYLKSIGCVLISEYDRRFKLSPLSFHKHPFSRLINCHQNDIQLLEELESIEEESKPKDIIDIDIYGANIIQRLLLKLFIYHEYNIVDLRALSVRTSRIDISRAGVSFRIYLVKEDYFINEKEIINKDDNSFKNLDLAIVLTYNNTSIESILVSDLKDGKTPLTSTSLQNFVPLGLNGDFTSVFVKTITTISKNFLCLNIDLQSEDCYLNNNGVIPEPVFFSLEYLEEIGPVNCIINGRVIMPYGQNWIGLLIAITEGFIEEGNQNLCGFINTRMYRGESFFSSHCSDQSASYKLSNGIWIKTNYDSQTILIITRDLCKHCGVELSDVVINYLSKDALLENTENITNSTVDGVKTIGLLELTSKITYAKMIFRVMSTNYTNGYRPSSIESMRFRSFIAKDQGEEILLSDDELNKHIVACGTTFDGKIYPVLVDSKERIKELVEEYFAAGAKYIFFEEFYKKNESWMFGASIVSEDMLIGILRVLFPKLSFSKTHFGQIEAPVFIALESEILRVWGSDLLLTYEQLADRLQYIPLDRIKNALGRNSDFIWSTGRAFSHVSRIYITDEEKEAILISTLQGCIARGHVLITDLPIGEIVERYYELSEKAVQSAIYQICLSDDYHKKGKIVMRKGDIIDALTLMEEHYRTIDKCSLDDLLTFQKALTGQSCRRISMDIGNSILVRIDKETFLADSFFNFNVNVIDEIIGLLVKNNYLPLKSFTTFGAFPDCGQTWNLFVLESYCRRFSQMFRLDALSTNSRNVGVIVRKNCTLEYFDIMADAVANAEIPLKVNNVGRFLYEEGYTGKRTIEKVDKIIEKAILLRGRRN